MKGSSRQWAIALVATVGVLAGTSVFADPPARVARLNYLKGSVSLRPAPVEDWTPATLNDPLTTGDHLWTDAESWAELHVGSTAIRLAPNTAFAFLNLDDHDTQMRLSEGALDVRVRNADGNGFEIDTPSAAVALTRPGVYRVDVLPDGGSTRVTVRVGAAAVTADGPDFWVRDGESAAIYGTDESVSHEIFRAAAPDNWERWCRTRDEREDRAASLRYVSYEMTGYEDLDEYGSWESIPEYGWGWRPRVVVGWSPYRYGQWRWVDPWGWTWVDEAPWGFAPFHYGRWACLRNNWYWFPGHYAVRPVYAPALVAFIGGDRWGLSFELGRSHVGWFPLAPGEFWMPHYHASHGYIRNLNVTNVNVTNINITNYDASRGAYINRAVAGAVTAVPRDTFLGGRAVARYAVGVDARTAMRAQVVGTSAPVAPRLESVTGGARAVSRPTPGALDRAVVARSRPPAAPVPFAAQERALQANGGRPLDEPTLSRLRGEVPRPAGERVRVAGARPSNLDRRRAEGAESPGGQGAADSRAGIATRRSGERATPEPVRPGSIGTPGYPGSIRSDTNDRPSWARPRGGADQPGNMPRDENGGAGVRGRIGGQPQGQARPRGGESSGSRGDTAQPAAPDRSGRANDRPGQVHPSGDDNTTRPGAGVQPGRPGPGGARSHGGEARPAPDSTSKPATARPRDGGGVSYHDSISGGWTNDRPAWAAERATPQSIRPAPRSGVPDARPLPQYRSDAETRPVPPDRATPQPGAVPGYRSAAPGAQATPRYHGVPEYRSEPESRPAPQYRVPESRPTPQYRVPDARPAPQSPGPDSRPGPESYRAAPRGGASPSSSGGGAVERHGGGGNGQPAAPQSGSPSGGGQATPRGARSHGRG